MGKLNVFQRLVRQWDELHPYNAAQVLHLRGAPDLGRWASDWNRTLREMGLGRISVHGARFTYHELNGVLEPLNARFIHSACELERYIADELNRPFDSRDDLPFRPFILSGEGSYYAGIVYHHWVADSASIRMLLREWFLRQFDPTHSRHEKLQIAARGYWQQFGPHRSRWELTEGLLSSVRWSSRFKRVRRIECPEFSKFDVGFALHEFPQEIVGPVKEFARRQTVTVNDVFLAAMAEACNQFVPVVQTTKRQDLALGTIVDLRSRGQDDLSDTFGIFLGFTSVICRPDDLSDWPRLLRHVARQSAAQKRTGVPEASMIRMLAGIVAARMMRMKREKIVNFYRKRIPLAGGISNVNLNRDWPQRYHPDPLMQYIRVSPTGPMMPLVFTTTTLGDTLNFGLTYREAVISRERAGQIAGQFKNRLIQLCQSSQ
ncbi:MAG TPA: condensation domain-containing protein [Tepidisphaeraceae bacterium]|nr:condensation domain-containing protein [Tepidisphaeraceae bacterium]